LTDNEGGYRFDDVPSGRYFIVLGSLRLPTFFPGTANQADAFVVSPEQGGAIASKDFVVRPPLEVRISGRVIRQSPGPVGGNFGGLILILSADDEVVGDIFPVDVAGDGSFAIPGVQAGVYELKVKGAPPDSTLTVVVGKEDIEGISVPVPVDKTIGGLVVLDDGGAIPDVRFGLRAQRVVAPVRPITLTPGTVAPSAIDGGATPSYDIRVEPKSNGAFQATLPEGTYQISVGGIPAGFHVKSATYGAVDLRKGPAIVTPTANEELRVTLGRGPAPGTVIVKGKVTGAGFSVSLAPDGPPVDADLSATIAPDGAFEFASVPPGVYTAWVLLGGGVSFRTIVIGPAGVTDLVIETPSWEALRSN
jgi:hypothetical protein